MKDADKKFWLIVFILIIAAIAFHICTSLHTEKVNAENKAFLKECEDKLWTSN